MPDTLITTEELEAPPAPTMTNEPPTLMTDEVSVPPTPTMFRFPNAETGMKALDDAGLLDGDLQFITASHTHSLDVIGTITRGGEWDDEGNVITPPEVLDGWHLNYQGELPDGWADYIVTPEQPVRVFF
jgi:hypothetical protein